MKKVTYIILIDGLRYDYLNEKDTPFLCSLEKNGIGGIVRETFAFQLRPAFFAGLYPEDCDIAHLYWHNPEDSPFRITRYIPREILSLPKIGNLYFRLLTSYARSIERKKGYSASSLYLSLSEIPYKSLRYFAFSERVNTWEAGSLENNITLFDILRENNLNWLWIAYPTHNQLTDRIVSEFRKTFNTDYSMIYLHFAELDWAGHTGGPHCLETKKAIREIDTAIEEVHALLNKHYSRVNGLVFGDHGMVGIKKHIDINKKLMKTGLTPAKDYIYFLDSTQARFWFKNESAKKKIEDLLNGIKDGRILTEEDLENLHFSFNHNRFGELIFTVNDNTLIFPNFFQSKQPVKGMHGYLPQVRGNWAKFIVTDSNKKTVIREPVEMVDLFPIILDLMGLPVPDTCRGVNPLR